MSDRPAEGTDEPQAAVRMAEKTIGKPTQEKPSPTDKRDELELGRFSGRYSGDKAKPEPSGKRSSDARNELELGRFSGRYSGDGAASKPARKRSSNSGGEVSLGRFSGRYDRDVRSDSAADESPVKKSEVVGPKRRKTAKKATSAKRKNTDIDLQIASPRDVSDDAAPSRKRAKRRSGPRKKGMEGWTRLVALSVLSIILVALTAATFLLLPRYQMIGDPLIAHPAFEAELRNWQQEGLIVHDADDPTSVALKSQDPDQPTFLTRDITPASGENLLILRAEVRGIDVEGGPEVWDKARIYLAQLDGDGEPVWDEDHELFDLVGTTELRKYSRAFSIPAGVESIRVGIELKNATGQLNVSRLELIEAERPASFVMIAGGLLLAWGALTLYSAFRTMTGIGSARIRIGLAIASALSIAALMMPGTIHEVWIDAVFGPFGIENPDVDVIGHAVVFTVLAFLVRLGRPQVPIGLHVGVWLLIAIASEVLQLFTFDREPSVSDLMVDGVGILLGLTLAEIVRSMQRWRTA